MPNHAGHRPCEPPATGRYVGIVGTTNPIAHMAYIMRQRARSKMQRLWVVGHVGSFKSVFKSHQPRCKYCKISHYEIYTIFLRFDK